MRKTQERREWPKTAEERSFWSRVLLLLRSRRDKPVRRSTYIAPHDHPDDSKDSVVDP